jgi:hypothetical protein
MSTDDTFELPTDRLELEEELPVSSKDLATPEEKLSMLGHESPVSEEDPWTIPSKKGRKKKPGFVW